MIESVIFDLDGTLVDSVEGIEFALKEAIQLSLPDQKFQINDLGKRLGPPIYQIIKQILPNIPSDVIKKIEQQFRIIYDNDGWKKTRLFDTMEYTLIGLLNNKISMFVVTNKPSMPTSMILTMTGLTPYLTDFLSPDFDGIKSYNKIALVNMLIEKHGLNRNNTLMVGDTVSDAQSAQLCDVAFIFAGYGYGHISSFEDYPVSYSIYQPIELLAQINMR
jgi:phosphoglycolate phosphatase